MYVYPSNNPKTITYASLSTQKDRNPNLSHEWTEGPDSTLQFSKYTNFPMTEKPLDILKNGLDKLKGQIQDRKNDLLPEKRSFLLKIKNGFSMMETLSMKKLSLMPLAKPSITKMSTCHTGWKQAIPHSEVDGI